MLMTLPMAILVPSGKARAHLAVALTLFSHSGYALAKERLRKEEYEKVIEACTEEIDAQGKKQHEARLLRGEL